ncbi:HTH_Tnp_Tc3_2 domain-containing protein [Trichonephila clavipes]|nr:HTH_Tnp_Tc3_2 domain-containing protein [Trichonephila clavipes]
MTGRFSYSAVFSIYAKFINNGKTRSTHLAVGRPRVKERGRWKLSRFVKQNWGQTVIQLIAQYNVGPSASVTEHTVQRTLLDMGLRSRCSIREPLLTKRHCQLRLESARKH